MFRNYLKTSFRNLLRHKLFSFINITGLAVSMSVGLLLIAFMSDLFSYDRFHARGARIYRVSNVTTTPGGARTQFASTSIKAGKRIREEVGGVEEVAILRNDFSGDARVGDRILPLSGYWAEPSLFRIFTFPMLEGNPETALQEPYSLVLTETTAQKLFGAQPAVGKAITVDTLTYQVTGVMKDLPFFSHIHFEALVSFSTAEQLHRNDARFESWTDMSSNFVYLLKEENADLASVQYQLDALAAQENRAEENTHIQLQPVPLFDLVVGESYISMGKLGPHVPPLLLWLLGGLALVVLLSACFNYTILTIARATGRFKEVGLRKTVGAGKGQIRHQFLVDALLTSLAALLLSALLFLLLRPQLITMAPEMQEMVKLELSPAMVLAFILFSLLTGLIAGLVPALFFSRVRALHALRKESGIQGIRRLPLQRALVLVQYTLTLIFITATAIGYVQYKDILAFDLGFNTENILNITMQGQEPEAFRNELLELPEVTAVSRSMIVTSVGNAWGGQMKYQDPRDSALVLTNHVDREYLSLHGYTLLAGGNFVARPESFDGVRELIVNEEFLRRFGIGAGDPGKAIGEEVSFSNFRVQDKKMRIVGVMQDFHYGKVDNLIEPAAFLPWTPGDRTVLNVKVKSTGLPATMSKIEAVWKKLDPVHPIEAEFYDESIEEAYSEYATLIKILGFLSFLAISIASMGLLGMAAFTTETRMKEISIRKVLGASSGRVMYLMSRGFIALLGLSALIALPATYLFFEEWVLTRFPYHTPVGAPELFSGLLAVFVIAFVMIGSQTIRAARTNPAEVLKGE